jgi:hypothetical protein
MPWQWPLQSDYGVSTYRYVAKHCFQKRAVILTLNGVKGKDLFFDRQREYVVEAEKSKSFDSVWRKKLTNLRSG